MAQKVIFNPFTGELTVSEIYEDPNGDITAVKSGKLNGNVITFERVDGTTFTVDVENLYDDTNLPYIVNGLLDNQKLTLERTDNSIIEIDISGIYEYTDSAIANVDANLNADLTALENIVNQNVTNIENNATTIEANANAIAILNSDVSTLNSDLIMSITNEAARADEYTDNAISDINIDIDSIQSEYARLDGSIFTGEVNFANNVTFTANTIADFTNVSLVGMDITSFDLHIESAVITSDKLVLTDNYGHEIVVDMSTFLDDTNTFVDSVELTEDNRLKLTMNTAEEKLVDLSSFKDNTIVSGTMQGDMLVLSKEDDSKIYIDLSTAFDDTNLVTSVNGEVGDVVITLPDDVLTTLTVTGNILTYKDEEGNETDIDLSLYVDDSNLARIISGTYDSNTEELVFTRDDGSTFTIDATAFFDNEDTYVESGSIIDDKLVLNRNDNSIVEIDISILTSGANYVEGMDTFVNRGSIDGDTLKLTKNDDAVVNIDISSITQTLAADVNGASLVGEELRLTKNDGTVLAVDLSTLVGVQENTYVDTAELSGNNLILNRNDNAIVSVDLSPIVNTVQDNSVESGIYADGKITLHKTNTDTVEIDVTPLSVDTNTFVDNAELIGNILSIHMNDGVLHNVDLSNLISDIDSSNVFINDAKLIGNVLSLTRSDDVIYNVDLTKYENIVDTNTYINQAELVGSILSLTNTDNAIVNVDLSGLVQNVEDTNTYLESGYYDSGVLVLTNNDNTVTNVDVAGLLDDTNLVTSVNGEVGDIIIPDETLTELEVVANVLKYKDENGDITDIDLNLYLDDANISLVVNGVYDEVNEELVFTRDDGSTFTIDAAAFFTTPDTFIESGSLTDGVLTLTNNDNSIVEIDMTSVTENTYLESAKLVSNTLSLTRNDGQIINVDLSNFENTEDVYLTDAELVNAILTLTNSDGSLLQVDLNSLSDQFNDTFVESADFTNGILTLTNVDNSIVQVDISTDDVAIESGKLENNILVFTKSNGDTINVDLNPLSDELSDTYIDSMDLNNGVLVLTNNNSQTLQVDLNTINTDTNTYVTDARINSGFLELERTDNVVVSVDLNTFYDDTNVVTSVNGEIGTVVLTSADIEYNFSTVEVELDTLNNTVSELQEEINAIEAGTGLEADGTYVTNTSTNYINNVNSLKQADAVLDNEIYTVRAEAAEKQLVMNMSGVLEVLNADSAAFIPYDSATISGYKVNVGTAAVGSSIKLVINKNGTLISVIEILEGETTATITTNEEVLLGDKIEVDVAQVGSSVAGADLMLIINITK